MICGTQGSQKSLLALFISQALTKEPVFEPVQFLGREVHMTVPVLYLDRENPPALVNERRQAIGFSRDTLHYWHDMLPSMHYSMQGSTHGRPSLFAAQRP